MVVSSALMQHLFIHIRWHSVSQKQKKKKKETAETIDCRAMFEIRIKVILNNVTSDN